MGKYQTPINGDTNDPNRSYEDGNPAQGKQGSIPPGIAIEWTQRELDHLIEDFGLTPDEDDNTQVAQAIDARIAGAALNALKRNVNNTLVAGIYPVPAAATITGSNLSFNPLSRNQWRVDVDKALTIQFPASVPPGGQMLLTLKMDNTGGHALDFQANAGWILPSNLGFNTAPDAVNFIWMTFAEGKVYVQIVAA